MSIYVAGEFSRIAGQERRGLAAIDAQTGRATPWNAVPLLHDQDRTSVDLLAVAGSTVIIGGNLFDQVGGVARDRLAAIDAVTGKLKPWKPRLSYWGIPSALLVSGDTLYVGGYVSGHLVAYSLSDVRHSK